MLKAKITVLLFVSIASVTNAQNDTFPSDTVLRNYISVHAVTSPIANGYEMAWTRTKDQKGEELSIFFSETVDRVRDFCTEFTDSTRSAIAVEDRLPFDSDISRYEIMVERHNLLLLRYARLSYNQKRNVAFRRSFGYRLTRWDAQTSDRPFFPSGSIFSGGCGQGGSLFGIGPRRNRYSETELIRSSAEETTFVHTLEAGFGLGFFASPLPRLKLALELNAFALLHLNQARLMIEAPGNLISTNYMLETKQQVALNFDLSAGLIWRLK